MMDFFKKIYLAVFPCEKEKETILSEKAEFKKKAEMLELRTAELRKELEEGQKNATLSAKEIVEKNLQLEKLMNELEASQVDIGVLAEKLEDAVRPTSSLCGKKMPAMMREVINPKRDNVYLSGFRIRYKNQNRAYDFRQYCAPVQVGGVCFDYVLDPEFFRPKMSAKEVFDKSLEIVQTKFGYETDSSLYQMLDSWAPPILTQTFYSGDCLHEDTLLLTDTFEFIPIKNIEEGQKIYGKDGKLTPILKKVDKGKSNCISISLSNGGQLTLTKDHVMFLDDGMEISAGKLKIGDKLLSVDKLETENIPCNPDDNENGWLEGVYVADGWHESCRISISGKDGHPKEKQKERVLKICEDRNWSYRWHERYISINNKELADKFKKNGCHAIEKHIPELKKSMDYRLGLLDGLNADASITKHGTIVFRSINPILALQFRVLHLLNGIRTSMHEITPEQHRGFGKHSIFEITTQMKRPQPIKVISIEETADAHVYDIQTENKGIYLPESNIVVHNCDDLSTFVVSLFDTYQLVFGVFPEHVAGVGVGFLVRGSSRECHAFPVLMRIDSDEWSDSFIGEATLPIARKSDTIEKLKENYTLEYGVITLPLEGAMNGGMVVMEGSRYWENSGAGPGDEKKDGAPNPKGKKKEKKKMMKEIWGGS